jgi:hypothetical protein
MIEPLTRIAKFEKIENNNQYWRYGSEPWEVDIRSGLNFVRDADIGDVRTFQYKVYGNIGNWWCIDH